MRNIVTAAVAASALFATQAMAQDYGNVYIGLGFGTTELDTTIGEQGESGASLKESTESYTGFIGYTFNEYISVEGAVTITGKTGASQWDNCRDVLDEPDDCGVNNINPPATEVSGISGDTDMRAFELAAKGTLPLGKFELFGRAGWAFGDFDYDYRVYSPDAQYEGSGVDDVNTVNTTRLVESTQDNGLLVGVGVGWNFGRGAIRLQYDYMGIEASETTEIAINQSDANAQPEFTQEDTDITFKTDKPTRLMLSFSGRF